jgi:hypothetical protein
MDWKEYFSNASGMGFLATANAEGEVNIAIYSKPRVRSDGMFVFGMTDRLTHANLQENPKAVYAFAENRGFGGYRLYLSKAKEETSGPLLDEIRRMTDQCVHPGAGKLVTFLVHFKLDRHLPMICETCTGDHTKHLCELAGGKKFDLITELAKMPDFICNNCGRMAKKGENLCNPMPIEDIPPSH